VSYAQDLRETFAELAPVVEDLFLLEAHQIALLPDRAPHRELAAVLHVHPDLHRFLVIRHPPIGEFLNEILSEYGPVADGDLPGVREALLWEIADWIVYQREPEAYDTAAQISWDLDGVAQKIALDGKVVIDAGAGTGRVAFAVAPIARHVFAVEPVAALRKYVREKASSLRIGNLFVLDGLLRSVPLPAETADVLLTCHAIGWDLERELAEIERVVKEGGTAMHMFGAPGCTQSDNPLHGPLLAHGYRSDTFETGDVRMIRYWKQIGVSG
jgi:SAM-dependent methyltransferase